MGKGQNNNHSKNLKPKFAKKIKKEVYRQKTLCQYWSSLVPNFESELLSSMV